MLDNQKLRELLSLSDAELRKTISAAAIAAGADKYITAKALADVGKLRGMMSALTPDQVNAMLDKISPDAANAIAREIEKNS